LGSANESSNGTKIQTFGDGKFYRTPGLGGLFTSFGAEVFISKRKGVDGEMS